MKQQYTTPTAEKIEFDYTNVTASSCTGKFIKEGNPCTEPEKFSDLTYQA